MNNKSFTMFMNYSITKDLFLPVTVSWKHLKHFYRGNKSMALLGNLISRSLRIRKQFTIKVASPRTYQMRTLRNLLERGQYTAFGKHYGFDKMLSESLDWESKFRENVPFHNYNSMFAQWWHKCLEGQE